MTLAELIPLAINVSMALIVFALGLNATLSDATSLLRQPGLLVRSILSMNVVMLILAVAAAAIFNLPPPVKIAIVALALSPVPPVLPSKQTKAGGSMSYSIGLLIAAAIVAIVLVPALMALLSAVFGIEARIPARSIATVVLTSIVIPLAIGIGLRHFAPAIAARIAKPISISATILLIAALIPVLFTTWPMFWQLVGNGVLAALLLFCLAGLAIGHFLGGPNPDDRTVLALATSTRHPGVAMAVAGLAFPDEKAVFSVVLFHLIIGTIASLPYVKWRTRKHAEASAP
jgi:bile acid:Na+ symporter, BASS family